VKVIRILAEGDGIDISLPERFTTNLWGHQQNRTLKKAEGKIDRINRIIKIKKSR
jgi:hypothetical protein